MIAEELFVSISPNDEEPTSNWAILLQEERHKESWIVNCCCDRAEIGVIVVDRNAKDNVASANTNVIDTWAVVGSDDSAMISEVWE